jgi:hypothetical protein
MKDVNETKRRANKTHGYVKTFRRGAVAANIFCRQAPGGFKYLHFGLSRSWKSSNGKGKEGYSQNFFTSSCEPLHVVIDQACHFIRQQSADEKEPQEGPFSERQGSLETNAVALDGGDGEE